MKQDIRDFNGKQKRSIRLMFCSGNFDELRLSLAATSRALRFFYLPVDEVDAPDIMKWLEKSPKIACNYKSITKR